MVAGSIAALDINLRREDLHDCVTIPKTGMVIPLAAGFDQNMQDSVQQGGEQADAVVCRQDNSGIYNNNLRIWQSPYLLH